jgi:hypothetical protein
MYGHFAAVLAAEGFIMYGLPRLASRVVLDYVWSIFQVLFLTVVVVGVSPRPRKGDILHMLIAPVIRHL